MKMNEYEYAAFQELLPECLQLSKENNIPLTDILLLRQLIVLQGLFNWATNQKMIDSSISPVHTVSPF